MTTKLLDSYNSVWMLHSYELHKYESLATWTHEHRLALIRVYVWMGRNGEAGCKLLDSTLLYFTLSSLPAMLYPTNPYFNLVFCCPSF